MFTTDCGQRTHPHNNNVSTKNPLASEGVVDWKMMVLFVKHMKTMCLIAFMNQHHAIMYIGLNNGPIKDAFSKWVVRAWRSSWENTLSWHVDKNSFHSC
jgi:hypothetical protein